MIYKHALRNALIPTFTVIGIYMSILIGGSVLTEIIFRRPGLGKMMVFAVKNRDYIALVAPWISPYDPISQDMNVQHAPPS